MDINKKILDLMYHSVISEGGDGAIVGSTFKPNKFTHSMIDRVLVREFMNKVKEVRKK